MREALPKLEVSHVRRFKPYPAYKPSRAEWLGDVPEHWETPSTKYPYSIQLGKMLQPEPSSPKDQEVPYLKSQHVLWERVRTRELPTMWVSRGDVEKYGVKEGDLLVCEGGDVGRAAIVQGVPPRTIIQNALHRVRPKGQNCARFLMYVLEHAAARNWFEILCNRATIAHFTGEKFGALRIGLPPSEEQVRITDFLDGETAKIDMLTTKKLEVIERLKEKRSALISRTVTQGLPADAARAAGLDPRSPLKSSRVEWLGDVPAHWDVAQLRRKALVLDCKHTTVSFVDDGVPVASIREVAGFEVNLNDAKQTTEEEYLQMIEGDRKPGVGDIIYSRNATVGDAALITTSERFCLGQDVCLIRAPQQNARFLLYLFRSSPLLQQVESLMIGSTFRRINVGQIKAFWICVPPSLEQKAIVAYLDNESAKITRMIEKVEAAIDRLQEYRSALITGAVTGKIDLRGSPAHGTVEVEEMTAT